MPLLPHPSRRALLRNTAAAALTPLLARWASAADDAKDSATFTFAVLNDLHYVDKDCGAWLAKNVIDRLNAQAPDFVLVVGDLTEHGTKPQNAGVRDVLAALKMPLHVTVGNHDHQAGNNDRTPYETAFPKSLNYHFEHKGWQFLALDSTQGHAGANTRIHRDTITYATDTLKALDKKKPTALFTHFPLGRFLPHRPANGNDLLLPFENHNLQAVFNGHFHSKTERLWGDAVLTTNTCCSFRKNNHDFDWRKGYFLCTAKDGQITRDYVQVNAPAPKP
jgi:calcineurin-like phosphoesterase family protein